MQDTPVAERGVTLQALLKFGSSIPGHLTTAEVVAQYIVPATAAKLCPYVCMVPPEQVAPPTHLVVHSWAAPFHHLLGELRAMFVTPATSANPYIWLDAFALGQHPGTAKLAKEVQQEMQAVKSMISTADTILISLGPHAEALSDLYCLHTICAAIEKQKQDHMQFFMSNPPALPFLVEAFSSINLTTATAPSHQDKRALLDGVVSLAAGMGVSSPFHSTADPVQTTASVLNPLLQRALIARVSLSAAAQAAPGACSAALADSLYLQAAMQLAGKRAGPKDAPLETAEQLASRCLALREGCRGATNAAAVAAARQLLAEVLRPQEDTDCVPADQARALQLLQQASAEWASCPGRELQTARALSAAAEVANSLHRFDEAQDFGTRAAGLLAALPTDVHPSDRAAVNAALGHALYHLGDFDGAEPLLQAAAEHHAAGGLFTGQHSGRRTAAALRDFALALLALRRPVEAEHWARQALSAAEAAFGPEECTTAECMEALALALLDHHCPPVSSSPSSQGSGHSCPASPTSLRAASCPPSPGLPPHTPPSARWSLGTPSTPPQHPGFFSQAPAHPSAPSSLGTPPTPPQHPGFFSAPAHPSAPSSLGTTPPQHPGFLPQPPDSPPAAAVACVAIASGKISGATARCAEAEELLRRRLRVMLQHYGRGHPQVVRGSHMLAQSLHRTQQYREAERIYLGVLQCLREAIATPPPAPGEGGAAASAVDSACKPAGEAASCDAGGSTSGFGAAAGGGELPPPLAAQASVELLGEAMQCCEGGQLEGMKTLLGGARSSSSTLDDALWRVDQDNARLAPAGPAPPDAGCCCKIPGLADVLLELAAVYDDWGRAQDADLCRRQSHQIAHHPA